MNQLAKAVFQTWSCTKSRIIDMNMRFLRNWGIIPSNVLLACSLAIHEPHRGRCNPSGQHSKLLAKK